jgi:hypothetical protein
MNQMIKKIAVCLIATLSLSVCCLSATAAETTDTSELLSIGYEVCYANPNALANFVSVGEPIDESFQVFALAASISVNVTEPCDAEFRAIYPTSYAYEANRAVERADDGLTPYGIDFISVSQPVWTSNGSTMSALLTDAQSDCGLTYNGSNTADLMVAFTGKTVDAGILGIASTVNPYALVKDGGYNQNAACAQHEIAHTYGCSHNGTQYDTDTSCIMYRYLNYCKYRQLLCNARLCT